MKQLLEEKVIYPDFTCVLGMSMKPARLLLTLGSGFLLAGCANEQNPQAVESKPGTRDKRIIATKRTSPELEFLRSKRYKYVTRVAAIPPVALAAMEGHAQLCDTASGIPINLTDVHINYAGNEDKECTKKLNFALVGDTCCLVIYRQGGIGVHDVIYYVHYRGKYSFTTDNVLDYLDDTVQLAGFLQKQPPIEKGYSDKIAPPPPWPTKAVNYVN